MFSKFVRGNCNSDQNPGKVPYKRAPYDKVAGFQALISLTVCSCHVTYAFPSESTLYSYLNVKELIARSRREIWRLSDCNWTQTHNHLVQKQTHNHLAKLNKWLSCIVSSFSFLVYYILYFSLARQWFQSKIMV